MQTRTQWILRWSNLFDTVCKQTAGLAGFIPIRSRVHKVPGLRTPPVRVRRRRPRDTSTWLTDRAGQSDCQREREKAVPLHDFHAHRIQFNLCMPTTERLIISLVLRIQFNNCNNFWSITINTSSSAMAERPHDFLFAITEHFSLAFMKTRRIHDCVGRGVLCLWWRNVVNNTASADKCISFTYTLQ